MQSQHSISTLKKCVPQVSFVYEYNGRFPWCIHGCVQNVSSLTHLSLVKYGCVKNVCTLVHFHLLPSKVIWNTVAQQ